MIMEFIMVKHLNEKAPMKRIIFFAVLITSQLPAVAQVSANKLCGDWLLKKGWFGDEQIVLEELDTMKNIEIAIVMTRREIA